MQHIEAASGSRWLRTQSVPPRRELIRSLSEAPTGRVRVNLALGCGAAQPPGATMYIATIGNRRYVFSDLKTLLAKASPTRSGDQLAGISAETGEEQVAAQYALADLPLAAFLREHVVPYETDEVTRLIIDTHDSKAFAPIAHLTVGDFRDWLLSDEATSAALARLA